MGECDVGTTVNELALQKLVIDSIREFGGFSFKLANRFLVGIPDLFIKLPGLPAAIYEVKISKISRDKKVAHLKVSPLQWKTLDDYYDAGGVGGIISFAKLEKGWGIAVRSLEKGEESGVRHYDHVINNHILLMRGKREQTIVDLVRSSIEWQLR